MSLDIKFMGDKFLRCRERLQFKTSEVSIGTGILMDKLEAIEKGEIEPLGDEILILADFYKEDYKFFISDQAESGSEKIDILYRKFGTEFSKEDRWAIQEFLFLCECEEFVLQELNIVPNKFQFQKQGKFHKDHGVKGAAALRAFLNYPENGILKNIFEDIRKTGVHVFRRKLENSNISGLFVMHPYAGRCILVNYDEDVYRQNFTLAHEVAHSIFDYQEKFNVSFKKVEVDYKEIRANVFASNFLMPEQAIRGLGVTNWSVTTLHKVANQLRVNITPLLFRLKELHLISPEQLEIFKKNYIKSVIKEDFELMGLTDKIKANKKVLIERGLSTFYVRQCHEAYMQRKVSRDKLAEMLLVDKVELPNVLAMFGLILRYEE